MLHKTWIFGYVSTVGTNPNQNRLQKLSFVCGSKYKPSLLTYQKPIKQPWWHTKDNPS